MKLRLLRAALAAVLPLLAAASSPEAADSDSGIYPAPCGRSVPPGVCTTSSHCAGAGGFWVERDCEFYKDLGGIGCCYDIPGDDD